MKTIIVYYSVSGQTEFVAKQIAKRLGCDLLKIETETKIEPDIISRYIHGTKSMLTKEPPKLKTYQFNKDDYDNIILGFPNWASNCPPAMKVFIAENKFDEKNIYLLTTYVARGGAKCLENVAKKFDLSDVKAVAKFSLPMNKKEKEIDTLITKFCDIK